MTEDWQNGGFGIYIHWPFCAAKCPYCDFNSHVARTIDHAAWRDAYLEEIRKAAEQTPGRIVHTVFFGGGTPSLMEPWVVADLIDAIRKHWPTANDMEITLEANPGSVEAQRFVDFRAGGVNRISMGIQALNDEDLRRLGRIHSADEARAAFDIARKTFDRVSFDLIYGRQKQTLADWESELKQALTMAIDHLSLYQLTIEQGTAFGDRYNAGKLVGLPDEDRAADMFTLTRDICADFGMPAYEVSNHARDGAQSRHNLIYWRYGDYVGIGPGAHGRLTLNGQRFATEAPTNPKRWLEELRQLPNVALTGEDQANEFLLMGLRLTDGVDLARFEALSGRSVAPDTLKNLSELGLLNQRGQNISVTEQGVSVLNGVLRELLAD
ncbi:radical SAM family heme chaperone HemW [Pseudosulfitobacter pseudonitzschiae]|uniref:radical SAM family heme chaperone HemW n=1 Tax=Pseudosulfitobacter pseudonitzschiae TaxID=1402135 RepID=UPI001AF3E33D|nr:radical SAM family heme chaperone HemW [Pseudosulfitobacter pseudonitzschiae]MBM1815615.1 coproporphyrinogen III oxidase [Pseudosulfitobacter pseudonitzschiae]MBM1832606.1 coproporphyrinogen III oxidase [Pseudosulfitobacter pseudonitzschiae]MBM1837474.1 coproporphyrinogen III oxidase [Pseudosulfitobacter pseudonitzschiae]MBM1842320.1 coproporphyrinogen III oxidase [Pseudosulfitobacter pseudonitzschiae]MBM1847188.1 coproporphyrinogen III oxidase [Pseudosulfitobacter pseudonitzschiae]